METLEEKHPKKPMTEQEALRKLASLCAKGEHCSGEMLTKMERWGLDESQQAAIMERLTQGKYIDDERFCRLFIHDKITFDKWGRRKIEQALWQKRIDPAIAKAALDQIDDRDYVSAVLDTNKRIVKLAIKFSSKDRNIESYEAEEETV